MGIYDFFCFCLDILVFGRNLKIVESGYDIFSTYKIYQ
jgi:hypothetical protein